MHSEFFSITYDQWRGAYNETALGVEYMPFEHFGLAFGLGSNNLDVVEDADDYRFSYDNRITALTLQLTTLF